MMDYIQANTNGVLHDAREPSLAPINRGFLYGDAIYEVWRTYGGVVFAWAEHWARLEGSAGALGIDIPFGSDDMFAEIRLTVREFRQRVTYNGDVYIRLQVYRGEGVIGLDPNLAEAPGYIILVQPVPLLSASALDHGLTLSISRELKRNPIDSLSPRWKSGNYLNNLLCLREAKKRGADDTLILNHAGHITESSTSNIGFIREGCFITPALSVGILEGITRGILIEGLAASLGLEIVTSELTVEMLGSMEECMLLSSTKDVQPVGRIDARQFPTGTGTLTRQLKNAFADYAAKSARTHPEFAV